MSVFGESKKTFKLTYAAPSTWRKIFLVYDNEVFRPKEKIIYDRHSTIPMFFVGSKVKIYSGSKFHSRIVNRWMVGYKFGEFSWTRKLALYKSKQLFRPSQINDSTGYGIGLNINRITKLDISSYKEKIIKKNFSYKTIANTDGLHHVNNSTKYIIFDVRYKI